MVGKDSGRKQVEQLRTTCIEVFKDAEQQAEQEPLAALDQMEDEVLTSLDEEAVALLTRLHENVEEFYELSKKIVDLMDEDEITETKLIDLFQTLIQSGLDPGRTGFARTKLK